jgi:6-phosphogluconolactonase
MFREWYIIVSKMVSNLLLAIMFMQAPVLTAEQEFTVYIGSYTSANSKGIYAFRFQPATGKLISLGLAAETVNPSFLTIHPNHRFLYAANEVSNGSISAFSIDKENAKLTFINKVSSGGDSPCHITIDKTGKWLFAANYGSGSVSVIKIKEDGSLGESTALVRHSGSSENKMRQEGPHAHSVNLSPDNRFLLVSDLGVDKVFVYRLDCTRGTLTPNDPPDHKLAPGTGPRHLSFHPNGRFIYQINELNSSITVFAYDPDRGTLRETETISTLPPQFTGVSTTAEVEAHPNGKFVYGSNRGHDSIAVFIFSDTGSQSILEPVEYVSTQGKTPRHFAVDPTGNFLFAANQNSDDVVLFRIDQETGKLSNTGTVLNSPSPVCVVFVP